MAPPMAAPRRKNTSSEMDHSEDSEPIPGILHNRPTIRKRKIISDSDPDDSRPRDSGPEEIPKKAKKGKKRRAPPTPAPAEEPTPDIAAEPRGVQELKGKAEKIYGSVLSFLTDPSSNTPGTTLALVMAKFAKLQRLLNESLLRNSHLEGQLAALSQENSGQRKTFEAITERNPPKPAARPLTYAERIGVRSKVAALSNTKRDPPSIITIRPKNKDEFSSSEKTREAVFQLVSPRKDKIQIRNVRNIQGNGILVEAAKKEDITTLLASTKLRTAGLVVGAPEKRNPRVIIRDVPRSDDNEATVRAIIDQNFDGPLKSAAKQQLKFAFKTGDRSREKCSVILEASREIREYLIRKERLYIGWCCCKVNDYVAATRCYKCQGFGHTTKHCKAQNEVCGHCSLKGHAYKNCPNKKKPATCINCIRASKSSDHCVTSNTCPAYVSAVNQVLARTDYGP